MNRYFLNISYIGTKFSGVQKQSSQVEPVDKNTVQSCLEAALRTFKPINKIVVYSSSRTDAGVHALSSAAHVDLERRSGRPYCTEAITKYLNYKFRADNLDIRIIKTLNVPSTFHSRFNAIGRTYLYRIAVAKRPIVHADGSNPTKINYLAFIPIEELDRCIFIQDSDFDIEKLKSAAKLFVGQHDFRTFMKRSKDEKENHARFSLRYISEIVVSPGHPVTCIHDYENANNFYYYWNISISGRSFLRRQIRRMIGALIGIARGRITEKNLYEMITIPSHLSWIPSISTVPPFALYLSKVHYNEEDFKLNEKDEPAGCTKGKENELEIN